MTDRGRTLIAGRRERIERALGRPLSAPPPNPSPLSDEERDHLIAGGMELYVNDLEWESLTGEEHLEDGPLAELTFPGVLAFVRGLLLSEAMPDSLAPADPRPEVVDALLERLADEVIRLEEEATRAGGEDAERARMQMEATRRLLDLVLMAYHGLSDEEVERVERAAGAA
ncbi:MAG: hypothetical protein D6701_09050 [Gemmatimonadetes bacterium]|nr:MAG: hypothetical protein D6701_09050 [Gemmatimonadota bacterium]